MRCDLIRNKKLTAINLETCIVNLLSDTVKTFTLFRYIHGCIKKFQDSTCKKKFAYLGC
jgi:hypothetical protein